MSNPTASPHYEAPPVAPGVRTDAREVTGYWWLGLVTGIAWIVISVVILQFDQASITTVGVLVGFMFAFAGAQNFLLAAASDGAENLLAEQLGGARATVIQHSPFLRRSTLSH